MRYNSGKLPSSEEKDFFEQLLDKLEEFSHKLTVVRGEDENFRVGTLRYSILKLILVFIFMIFGGMAYNFMGNISHVFSITLHNFHANAVLISIIIGVLPACFNATVCPIISFKSDRTRSKWGRRVPYLLIPAPFLGLSLAGMGFSPQLAALISAHFGWNCDLVGIWIFTIFLIIYEIFYMFVGSVYFYLFNDVIPQRWIGVFNAFFHFIGTLLGFLFNLYIFKYVEGYAHWVYAGMGAAITICYLINGFCIKEGEYPPPNGKTRLGFFEGIVIFCKECFATHPFYLIFFTMSAMTQVSGICRALFDVLFATASQAEGGLGFSAEQYGKLGALSLTMGLIFTFPVGALNSVFKPIYVYTVGMVLVIVANVFGFIFVYDWTTYLAVAIGLKLAYCAQTNSEFPLNSMIFPHDRFGQFCSAQSIFRSAIRIATTVLAGIFIHKLGYRYLYVWDFMFTVIQFLLVLMVFYYWRKLGGPKNYVAP